MQAQIVSHVILVARLCYKLSNGRGLRNNSGFNTPDMVPEWFGVQKVLAPFASVSQDLWQEEPPGGDE